MQLNHIKQSKKMLCCLNPDCPRPLNPDVNKFCQACSTPLVSLLRNRFRVMRVLSNEGGFGKTYLAEDTDKLNEHCVIKQLAPKVQGTWAVKKAMELFGEEAKRLQDLGEHPQIPTLFAYFEQDNFLYLVQQFIEGQNLLNELEQGGRYSESKARGLLLDLLQLLKFIHDRQVIHRDIKPGNIMRRGALGAFFSCVETCYLPNPTFTIQNLKLPKLDDVELISAVGMDYSRLGDLLAAGKWKLANQETERVMFIVAKREEEGWLRVQDIDNFPCEDLRTINQLWVEYSNGRFGFSVQKQIYQDFGGSRTHLTEIWDTFGEAVGWKKRGGLWRCGWVNYSAITFDIKAPKGHLPVWKWTLYIHSVDNFNSLYAGGVDWGNGHGWDWISSLASRLVNCNI